MASRIHSLLPQLAMALVPLALVAISWAGYRRLVRTYDVPNDTNIFQAVEGKWTLSGASGNCDTNWMTVHFTPDHADMLLLRPQSTSQSGGRRDSLSRYPLLGHTRHSIQVVRRGETSLNTDSTPVVWDLILRSPNTYAWHRSDWLPITFTHDLRRCPT